VTPPPTRAGRPGLADLVREAHSTVVANPLRAGLAVLAVAAAVATVAVTATALEGIERSARLTSARAFGSDTFVIARVVPGQSGRRELADKLARNPVITRSDTRFLDRHAGLAGGVERGDDLRLQQRVHLGDDGGGLAGGGQFSFAVDGGDDFAVQGEGRLPQALQLAGLAEPGDLGEQAGDVGGHRLVGGQQAEVGV